jgi:hypothetical protein
MQLEATEVNAIDLNAASAYLQESEQSKCERRFSTTGSANNANTMA